MCTVKSGASVRVLPRCVHCLPLLRWHVTHVSQAAFYGKDVVLADLILPTSVYDKAKIEDVSFLVVGDPFQGRKSSHTDLIIQAAELGVQVSSCEVPSPRRVPQTLLGV